MAIEEVSDDYGILAVQGPRSRDLLAALVPGVAKIPFFGLTTGKIAGSPVTVSRTGYSGDLGYEVWVRSDDALKVWDALWASMAGFGVLPFGLDALDLLRIEAGLLLLDVDFASSRYGWTDEDRSSLIELGWGWMVRDLASDDRAFIGRRAIERELADKTSRWRLTGLIVDWADYDRIYGEAGLIPPKDHTPILGEMFLYDDDSVQVGYTTSYMYSPDAPTPHRPRPGPTGPRRAGHDRPTGDRREPPLRVRHRADGAAPPLQPPPEDGLTCRRRPRPRSHRRRRKAPSKRAAKQRRRPDVRRDRRRWRSQRPDQRRLPRQGRAEDPDPRAAHRCSAARRSPRSSTRASGSRPSRTR